MILDTWWKLVRFGFRLLYNEFAFTYDWVSWIVSLGQWRNWQRASLNFLPDPAMGTILELAHGTGNLQIDLQNAGYRTIAFDLSPYMGRIARKKIISNQQRPNFVRGNAQSLPFSDASFTNVVSTFPTDFIVQPETLRAVYRVLQEDGKLIIVLNGVLTGGGIVRKFLEWLYRITGQRDESVQESAITDRFAGYGFQVEAKNVECDKSIAQLVILTKVSNS